MKQYKHLFRQLAENMVTGTGMIDGEFRSFVVPTWKQMNRKNVTISTASSLGAVYCPSPPLSVFVSCILYVFTDFVGPTQKANSVTKLVSNISK